MKNLRSFRPNKKLDFLYKGSFKVIKKNRKASLPTSTASRLALDLSCFSHVSIETVLSTERRRK
jgi:hypothetical protein